MFNKISESDVKLEIAISDMIDHMNNVDRDSDEWLEYCSRLERLKEMRVNDKRYANDTLSPDTLAAVAGNLAGIAMIVNYERIGVVTTKALSLLMKIK